MASLDLDTDRLTFRAKVLEASSGDVAQHLSPGPFSKCYVAYVN